MLVATKSPYDILGFCCIRPWPRVDEPGVFQRHVWGRRIDTDSGTPSNQPILIVLAHSPVAKTGQTSVFLFCVTLVH